MKGLENYWPKPSVWLSIKTAAVTLHWLLHWRFTTPIYSLEQANAEHCELGFWKPGCRIQSFRKQNTINKRQWLCFTPPGSRERTHAQSFRKPRQPHVVLLLILIFLRCETEKVMLLLIKRKSKLSVHDDLEGLLCSWDNSVQSVAFSPEPNAGIKQENDKGWGMWGHNHLQQRGSLSSFWRPPAPRLHQCNPVLRCYEKRAALQGCPKLYSIGHAGKQLLRRMQTEF